MIENFTAGDTVSFTTSYTDYRSDNGWSATVYFSGPSTLQIDATAGTEGDFVFQIPATQTAYLKAGLYSYAIRVTSTITKKIVESGAFSVYQNPEVMTSKEAIASRMIELIEKALINQLSSGEAVESMSIAGRSLTLMNRTELLTERGFWNRELKALRNARTGNSGIKQIRIHI